MHRTATLQLAKAQAEAKFTCAETPPHPLSQASLFSSVFLSRLYKSEHNQAKAFNKAVGCVRNWVTSCNPAASSLPTADGLKPRGFGWETPGWGPARPNDADLHLEGWPVLEGWALQVWKRGNSYYRKRSLFIPGGGGGLFSPQFSLHYQCDGKNFLHTKIPSLLSSLVSFRLWISLPCTILDPGGKFTVTIKHSKNTTNHTSGKIFHHQRLTFIKR